MEGWLREIYTSPARSRVIFDFTGFLAPILNPPAILDWKAGDGLSIAFSLDGDQGLAVLASGYPRSAQVSCTTPGELTSGVPVTSNKPLDFARGGGGRYHVVWMTQKAWAGTCQQLIVKLSDGTFHRATVRFK